MTERADFAADSICVMLVLPAEIAGQFSDLGEHGPAHVTLAHVKHGTPEQAAAVREIALATLVDIDGEEVRLGGLSAFEHDDQTIPFVEVEVSDKVRTERDGMVQKIQAEGLEVSRVDQDWVPHATLGRLAKGETFDGDLPSGSFEISADNLMTTHGGQRTDTIRRKGDKWQVWSEDGSKLLGEFDDEGEARERLRQIEAAKATRSDMVEMNADGSITFNVPAGKATTITRAAKHAGSVVDQMVIKFDSDYGAPAVITEPKTLVEFVRTDKIEVGQRIVGADLAARLDLAEKAIEDINGWVIYPMIYSRGDNIQVYSGVREFRPWSVVKDPNSLALFPGTPWELRHSRDLLTPDTVAGAALGALISAEPNEADKDIRGLARAWGRALIDAIEKPRELGGTPDISMAYRVKVDRRGGTDDNGNPFDQRVAAVVPNSAASEPHGRAGTTRVLARKDAAPVGRTELLAMATGAKPIPAGAVYFGPTTRDPSADERPSTRKDQAPMNMALLMTILDDQGLSVGDVAAALGVDEEVMATLLDGTTEMSDDQMKAFAGLLRGKATDADPPGAEDDERAALIADLESQLEKARADRNLFRADAASKIAPADADAKVEAAVDTIGQSWGVPRKDAAEDLSAYAGRVAADGQRLMAEGGKAIALAWRGHGSDFTPEARKDAGVDLPITVRQWKTEAVLGSYGHMAITDEEKAAAEQDRKDAQERIDRAPDAAVDYILDCEVKEAVKRLDAKDSKVSSVKQAVERAATNNAEVDRQDGEKQSKLRAASERAKEVARDGGQKGDN